MVKTRADMGFSDAMNIGKVVGRTNCTTDRPTGLGIGQSWGFNILQYSYIFYKESIQEQLMCVDMLHVLL